MNVIIKQFIMRKIILLLMLASITLSTQARKVMFRVNMTGVTVSANGVHLAGNFKDVNYDNIDENPTLVNWSPSAYTLTDPDLDGIYTIVLDLKDSTAYEFKYINDNNWGPGEESIPSASQVGGGNSHRWVYVKKTSATDTLVLDAIAFGGNAPVGMKLVRFRVNMKNETVNVDGVHVAGAFQGWNPSISQMVNYTGNGGFGGTTYEYIGYVTTAGGTEFKYVNDNDWAGAESVPSACNVNGNRSLTNVTSDTILTNVCFGSCDVCPAAPIPTYNVTFRVDMSSTCTFDSVDVAGGKINNWAGGTILSPVSAGSSIYSVTVSIDSGEVEYKFRKFINGNVSWEGVANRIKAISSDTVLALVCFDKDTLCTPLPPAADVTFIVDLSNEIPDPNGDVYIMGNFTEPNWQNGAIKMTPITGQIGMYQATFNMCPGTFAYKFTNGLPTVGSSEETFPNLSDRGCVVDNGVGGFNRTFERTNGNAVTLGFVFNTCTTAVVTGIEKNKLAASSVSLYPNPTEENATVNFNDNSTISHVIISDIAGRMIVEYKNVNDKNLNINTSSFESGIYFVSVVNDKNEIATVKLMVR